MDRGPIIYVYGEALDMLPNAAINVESASPIFENEILRGEYSYPFTIPLTNRNRTLLGYMEEVHSITETKKIPVQYERLGATVSAMLYIDEVDFDFNTNTGTANCSLVGIEGYFYALIQSKKLENLHFGGSFPVPTYATRLTVNHSNLVRYASDIANGTITGMPFIFPMIKWDNFGLDGLDFVPINGFINYYSQHPANTGSSVPQYEFAAAGNGLARTIPMFYVSWVIKRIFLEVGFTVTGDLFNDTTFNALYVVNNFAINKWYINNTLSILAHIDKCTEINPANHMPDMLVTEFLNAICQLCNVQFIATGLTTFNMVRKKAIVNNGTVTEIDKIKISSLVAKKITDVVAAQNGINLAYKGGDTIYSTFTQGSNYTITKGTVADYSALSDITPLNGDVYYVTADTQYYQYNLANLQWQTYNDLVINGDVELFTDLNPAGMKDGDIWFVRSVNELIQYTVPATFTRYSRNFVAFKQYPAGINLNLDGAPLVNMSIPFNDDYVSPTIDVPHIDAPGRWFANQYDPADTTSTLVRTVTPLKVDKISLRLMLYFGITANDVALPDGDNSAVTPYAIPYSSGYNRSAHGIPHYDKKFDWNLNLYGPEGIYNTFYADWDRAMLNSIKYVLQVYMPEHDVNNLDFTGKILALQQLFLIYKKAFNIPYLNTATLEVYVLKEATGGILDSGAPTYEDSGYIDGGYVDDVSTGAPDISPGTIGGRPGRGGGLNTYYVLNDYDEAHYQ